MPQKGKRGSPMNLERSAIKTPKKARAAKQNSTRGMSVRRKDDMGRRTACQAIRTIGVGPRAISSTLAYTSVLFPFLVFNQQIIDCLAQQYRLGDAGLGGQRVQQFRLLGLEIERLELKPAGRHCL